MGKNYELLNCDDHANFLRRHNKDPAAYRPDICHQVSNKPVFVSTGRRRVAAGGRGRGEKGPSCRWLLDAPPTAASPSSLWLTPLHLSTSPPQALLAILDSPLNKAGRLKALYVHTAKNVLIQVNPQVRREAEGWGWEWWRWSYGVGVVRVVGGYAAKEHADTNQPAGEMGLVE